MTIGAIFAFAAYYSESESGGGGLLSVNPGLAFWTVLTFLILLFILKKVAWKPILTALDERENKIKESLEMAEKAKAEAQRLIEENKLNMAKAGEEAQKILAESRKYAEQLKQQMLEESKAQAARMLSDASQEIERKKQEAFGEIKAQVAEISINIAEKLLRKNLDKKAQDEIVSQYINEIPNN